MNLKRILFVPILGMLLTACEVVTIVNNNSSAITSGKIAVRVDNDDTSSLKMSTRSSFDSSSLFMEVTDIPKLEDVYTYAWFEKTPMCTFEQVHNENTDYTISKSTSDKNIKFVKYTFFLKNEGTEDVNYYIDINLIGCDKSGVDEYIRVMVFEGQNKQTVYAKRSLSRTEDANNPIKEYVSGQPGTDNDFGQAELFDGSNVTGISSSLSSDEKRMYTLLFWLEGSDPECNKVPENFFLNVETNIKVYK